MTRTLTALVSLALLASAAPAWAATEQGDAGDLPATAQDLATETVDRIDGQFASGTDIDMYRICVAGGKSFSASTIGGTAVDTQLFLFDAGGRAVYMNDDLNGSRQSLLPAGHELTPSEAGTYYLAVGPYNLDPESAPGLAIFPVTSGVQGPVSPGGDQPVTGWGGRSGSPGAYSVSLTGSECEPPDTTPPTIDLTPADGEVVGRGDTVEVHYTCADEGGSGLASCVGTVADGAVLDTSEVGPLSVTVVARDNAGNETTVTHTVTVVAVDRTPPAIRITSPLDGALYLLNRDVPAAYSCAEEKGGSGLVSCVGDLPVGSSVDTGSVGPHSFTVNASDQAGNTSSATSVYRVIYEFEGFLGLVENPPAVNRRRAGQPIWIKFELGGKFGDVVPEGWPQSADVGCDFSEEPASGRPAQHPRWTRELNFVKRKSRYVFIWSTDRSWAGTCRQFMLKLDDGTVHRANFKFTRGWVGF